MSSVLGDSAMVEVVDSGRLAAWLEPVPLRSRLLAFAWRFLLGFGIAAWLASAQLANNVRGPEWLWTLGIFTFGLVMGVRAFRKQEVRRYETTVIHYTSRQRLKRAAKWVLPGVAMLAFVWGVQLSSDQFATYWWYAWPAVLPVVVGVGLFLLRSERVLSGPGQHARAQDEAAQAQKRQEMGSLFERLLEAGPVRYAIAALCFYGAYYFAFEDTGKKAGLAAVCALIVGFVFARELGLWLLGLALVVGIGWALFAGIAALPVSVAVIVGALIIASAVRKK